MSDLNRRALARAFDRIHIEHAQDSERMVEEMQIAIAEHLTAPDLAEVMSADDLEVVSFMLANSEIRMSPQSERRLPALRRAFSKATDIALGIERDGG